MTSSVYFLMGWSLGGFYCIHYYTIHILSRFLSFFSSPRRGNDRWHLIPLHHILQVLTIPHTRCTRVYSAMRSQCYWIIISFFFRSRDSKSWKIRYFPSHQKFFGFITVAPQNNSVVSNASSVTADQFGKFVCSTTLTRVIKRKGLFW